MSQVFRVERTKNFTVMANYHLNNNHSKAINGRSLQANERLSSHSEQL